MSKHRRTPNPDYFKTAGSTVEDRDLTAEARRKVTQERKRARVRRRATPHPRVEPAHVEPPSVEPRRKASSPEDRANVLSPTEIPRGLPLRALRFAWSVYTRALRAGAAAALRRWIPDSTRR